MQPVCSTLKANYIDLDLDIVIENRYKQADIDYIDTYRGYSYIDANGTDECMCACVCVYTRSAGVFTGHCIQLTASQVKRKKNT